MKIKNSIAGLLEGKKQERKRKPFTELKGSMKKKLQKEILGLINSNPRISQLLNDHKCTLNDIGIFGGVTTKAQSQYNKICEAKDLCFISDRTMDKFKRLTDLDLPTKSFIQNHRKLIIKKIPKSTSNDFGVFFDAAEMIFWVLSYKIQTLNIKNGVIRINLRGDKTNVGQKQHFFNFCFALLDEDNASKTASGQYTLGIFDVEKDDYETMSKALESIVISTAAINKKNVSLNGKDYLIDMSLSGDAAWLTCERGQLGCGSNYPCFYCTLHKKDFFKNNSQTSKSLARSVESSEILRKKKTADERKGYSREPIFKHIGYENVVHDTLHEHIRIPNSLMKFTLQILIKKDNSKSTDITKCFYQHTFAEFLKTNVKIKSPYRAKGQEDKESSNNFIFTKLSGFESLLASFEMRESAFGGIKEGETLTSLFNDYFRLHKGYITNFYENKPELFQERVNKWTDMFNSIFHGKLTTVYMHIFSDHVAELIKQHGDIDIFNIQGLEKKNDLTTTEYFRGSNRRHNALQQMFDKRARCLYYKLNEEKLPKSKTEAERTTRLKIFFKETDIFSLNMDQLKQKIMEITKVKNNERTQGDEQINETTNIEASEAASIQLDDSDIEPDDILINDDVTSEDDETISLDEFSDTDENDEGES